MILNLDPSNADLYEGCTIKDTGTQLIVKNPAEAVPIIARNANRLIEAETDRSSVTLTGRTAIWAYLVVFHAVVHRFHEVWYKDDKDPEPLLIAEH